MKETFAVHRVLSGSHADIGRQLAAIVSAMPPYLEFFRSGQGRLDDKHVRAFIHAAETYSPGTLEELRSFTDELSIPFGAVAYLCHTYLVQPRCSHFAVLGSRTSDGNTLVARSYEFNDEQDDGCLHTIAATGERKIMGSTTLLFGLNEGMNDAGLVVTMSAGGMPVGSNPGMQRPFNDGVQFWFGIRALLERCSTVGEAVTMAQEMPFGGNPILIMADRQGRAALMEIHGHDKAVTYIDVFTDKAHLSATNHYQLDAMVVHRGAHVMANSIVRKRTIESFLSNQPAVDVAALKRLLGSPYPSGLSCNYFEEFFGTVRSMVFEPYRSTMHVSFGPPTVNPWHEVDFTSTASFHHVKLPRERAPKEVWNDPTLKA